ncbi:MAG: 2-oxoacid:acceptor oxidoreductase family protein [Vallitaleaceae bacterium]|jgi:2-oxoglutarate ferredoxin oxidoreductase subunit gamma|nr:2-oxoacid:acceptor oxidoreductase family protein [Vallitaleaceae bacterium]
MIEKVIMAGFGGQGIMSIGQMLAYAGMTESKEVSWLPSYGPEMRGGTANCHVIVSDTEVASPVVYDATAALILNKPSLYKFEDSVKKDGFLLINSSLIDVKTDREDVHAYYIPANDIALELGNIRIANMVMLGAYIALSQVVKMDSIIESLKKVLGKAKENLVEVNVKALLKGASIVQAASVAV